MPEIKSKFPSSVFTSFSLNLSRLHLRTGNGKLNASKVCARNLNFLLRLAVKKIVKTSNVKAFSQISSDNQRTRTYKEKITSNYISKTEVKQFMFTI